MNYYFITGASSGIGKALADKLLEDETNYVYGISRTEKIDHPRYMHIKTDLSVFHSFEGIEFPIIRHSKKIVLINNAGQIGDIKPIGKSDNVAIADLLMVNVTAPAVLMNNFIYRYSDTVAEKIVLNVSSGAAKNAIEGWAPYCGSKAAIDLLSLTVFEEQKKEKNPVKVYSIAPGVVDTEMQVAIRNSNENDFSKHAHFVSLKENNELSSPEEVATKYLKILENPTDYNECVFSLRDL